jgi:hypothetical protein
VAKSGFAFSLSNGKGREFFVAPFDGVDSCTVKHKTIEIEINSKEGSFRVVGDQASREGSVRILSFRRLEVDVPTRPRQLKEELEKVHTLDCFPTDCCCNCGDGWICG